MANLVSVLEFEEHAYNNLPKNVLDYYKSGAGKENTLLQNRTSFNKYKLRPRFLRNVEHRDLSTVILGHKISIPIGIAPTAMQRMAHPQGECANVKAAQALGTIFTLSTLSTSSIEEVAQAAPHAIKWYQLYIYKDREVTRELVTRAERAGFKALVLTVDAPVFGIRLADEKNKFSLPSHLKLANFQGNKATKISDSTDGSGLTKYVAGLFDPTISWEDVKWLKSITNLPIVLKGILTAEDALLGVKAGASAIQVSNHGARQIDGTAASIEALPEIIKAVGDKVEVYLDGGITDGIDVLKALSLGAKMVFIGRAALWGLAHSGQEGVERVLNIIKNDLSTAMACSGCTKKWGLSVVFHALLGVQAGASAIQVSNYGARQIGGTAALPEIVKAVGDKVEVYLDGGITDGIDVLKALSLGAKMVFIGRTAWWGLAHSDQKGVERVLNIIKNDLSTAMACSGYTKTGQLPRPQTNQISDSTDGSGLTNYVTGLFDSTISWEDVKWLKSISNLPIVLKGILTAEDALLGVQAGASAIQVSNYGARQIGGTAALPEILKAVGDKVEVYLDGGITDGIDVLKALSLGAKMVFIGRAALWGLTHSGQAGVERVLNIIKNDLSTAMACSGCTKVSEIEPNLVVHESYYAKL